MSLNLHLDHLEGPAQDAAVDIAVPQLVLGAAVVGKLDEIGEGVLLEDEGELLAVARPVGNGRGDVEEDLKADLFRVRGTKRSVSMEGEEEEEGESQTCSPSPRFSGRTLPLP